MMQRYLYACALCLLLLAHATQAQTPPAATSTNPSRNSGDFVASALWDGRKVMPFRALDNPKMGAPADASAYLNDDEYVLGVTINGQSRAYPTRLIWFHHVVNDTFAGVGGVSIPVAITYCSVCNTGLTFENILDGKPIQLDFYGLYNGVVALCDRATESVLTQVNGEFVTGTLKGKRLKQFGVLDTTWGRWRKLHPETRVMVPEEANAKYYRPKGMAEPRGYTAFPAPYFGASVTRKDPRLPEFEKVLGVLVPLAASETVSDDSARQVPRAYAIKTVRASGDVLNDATAGRPPIAVFLESETETANAFSPKVGGELLTFERRSADGVFGFFDRQTGSEWNLEGVAITGKHKGQRLTRLPNHLSQWYGWSAFYPSTEIYAPPVRP